MGVRSEVERIVRESWRETREENVTFMAGSIAYYAFVSMLPLLLFALVVLSVVGNETFTASLAETTEPFLTPYARGLVVESLDIATAQTGVSVVGVLTLLWGISKIFRGLDVAFSKIYGTESNKTLLRQFENAVVVFTALTVAIVAFVAVGVVAALVPDLPYPPALNSLFLVVGLAVAFFPIYYVFPDVDVTPRQVLPGTLVAAVGWAALEAGFQGYVTYAARYEAVYGTLGSAFLLLIWLYFSSLVLLFGGVVNAVLARQTGDEHALGDAALEDAVRRAGPDEASSERGHRAASASDRPDGEVGRASATGGPVVAESVERARSDGELARVYDELDADRRRLREEVQRLETQNARLRRVNDALTRRLARRRRSVVAQAKRWLFDR
ncbi:YihY/virulence factor BrkB family protein [Halorussus caseinilyticus]|uniref:YihY/virulence factor BrkB family protein n=1 Tax=Halorussus caseinilyticus TaxID=3034025 RepID=UPI0023E88B70|nr:YihY/virulence factor BrkB family protein [Halorussus sp. DT72]